MLVAIHAALEVLSRAHAGALRNARLIYHDVVEVRRGHHFRRAALQIVVAGRPAEKAAVDARRPARHDLLGDPGTVIVGTQVVEPLLQVLRRLTGHCRL